MLILDAIRDHVAPVEQHIRAGDVFHLGQSLDDAHRSVIRHVLRPMLPVRFGLTVGRAFSVDDACTHADGILIYDALHALPMGTAMPCETVFAVCRVCQGLDEARFEQSVLDVASLKQLNRAKATAHDVTPTNHLGVFGARYAQLSDDKLNPYLGYVFAHDGSDPNHLLDRMNTMIEDGTLKPEHTPDAIACLRGGWLISRQTRTGDTAVPRSSFARFGVWHLNAHLLPVLYVLLNVSLSQIQLRGPDLLRALAVLTKGEAKH